MHTSMCWFTGLATLPGLDTRLGSSHLGETVHKQGHIHPSVLGAVTENCGGAQDHHPC